MSHKRIKDHRTRAELSARIVHLEAASAENIRSLDEKITHLQEENDRLKQVLRERIESEARFKASANRSLNENFRSEQQMKKQIENLSRVISELWESGSDRAKGLINIEALERQNVQTQVRQAELLEMVEDEIGVKL